MKKKNRILKIKYFFTHEIWRITENEVSRPTYFFLNIAKTIYVCITRFSSERISNKASALTYSTLLAIVPLMAVLFGIARGFGFSNLVENQLKTSFAGHPDAHEAIMSFVNSYLSQTQGGVFIGFGLVLLLWTVLNLTSNIEITFNRLWEIKESRSLFRKVTDYFSMLLLLPVLIVVSSGITLYMNTIVKDMIDFVLLAPILQFLIQLIPYVLIWIIFTGLYIFMPNTKVQFKHAFISGLITGTAYQFFQLLYISGQIWVSRYNAIYGSFAALPLFLLWLQVSWTICLFGVELTYAGQNIKSFSFDKDTHNISRRYNDYITTLILSLIVHRFVHNEPPYSASEIAEKHQIPLRLTKQILYHLKDIGLIYEMANDRKSEQTTYSLSVDPNQLNMAMLMEKLDNFGSEDFKISKNKAFNNEWEILLRTKNEFYHELSKIRLKDLT